MPNPELWSLIGEVTRKKDDENSSSINKINPIEIKCPSCGLLTVYSSENPSRPFCSARCKLIDLGQWADQTYKIPSTPVSIDSELRDDDDLETKD